MKKNTLKNLIYLQENDSCTQQTTEGLLRAIIEPILEEKPEEALILLRLRNVEKFSNLFQRLKFTNAQIYDFSASPLGMFKNILKEDAWENVEFVFVLTRRYGATLIFDYTEEKRKGFAQYFILHNSRTLHDILDLINEHSEVDLSIYKEEFKPDRRENELMNLSIRKIVKQLNEFDQEVLFSNLEKETIETSESFVETKTSYVAHEIKNQLAIIDLYSNIIGKKAAKIDIKDFDTALFAIQKTLQLANNSLMDLRSINHQNISVYDAKTLILNAMELGKAYTNDKKITMNLLSENTCKIAVDENNFTSILINLIKNASEAIDQQGEIGFKIDEKDDVVEIKISNNGKSVEEDLKEKIFETGFSTKEKGRGLGLYICKKSTEEMGGNLYLEKSDNELTVFILRVLRG